MRKTVASKGRSILREKSNIKPPPINGFNDTIGMVCALNYYRENVENKVKKELCLKFLEANGFDVNEYRKLGDSWFVTAGAIAHMQTIGHFQEDADMITKRIVSLLPQKYLGQEETPSESPSQDLRVTQDRPSKASEIMAEINANIDDKASEPQTLKTIISTITHSDTLDPKTKRDLQTSSVQLEHLRTELNEAMMGTDRQLAEGYSHLGKRGLKTLINRVDTYIKDIGVLIAQKIDRKPRLRKPKPPALMVKKMIFMPFFEDLGARSIDPAKIIGATEVWLYNTKLRKLAKYVAIDGCELTVKGTTILNFDTEASGCKTIRKPDVVIKPLIAAKKRAFNAAYNGVNATHSSVTGRTNQDTIILAAF